MLQTSKQFCTWFIWAQPARCKVLWHLEILCGGKCHIPPPQIFLFMLYCSSFTYSLPKHLLTTQAITSGHNSYQLPRALPSCLPQHLCCWFRTYYSLASQVSDHGDKKKSLLSKWEKISCASFPFLHQRMLITFFQAKRLASIYHLTHQVISLCQANYTSKFCQLLFC